MQFSIIAIVLSAAFAAAAPAPAAAASAELSKRTCGTLSGTALKVCQDACKVTCDAATGGLARKLCKAACDAGPLKVRTVEVAASAPVELSKRTCGTLSGTPLKVCQDACKVTCDAATGGLARKLCKAACDAGPLKVREEATADELEAHAEAELTVRGFGHEVCDAAVS